MAIRGDLRIWRRNNETKRNDLAIMGREIRIAAVPAIANGFFHPKWYIRAGAVREGPSRRWILPLCLSGAGRVYSKKLILLVFVTLRASESSRVVSFGWSVARDWLAATVKKIGSVCSPLGGEQAPFPHSLFGPFLVELGIVALL